MRACIGILVACVLGSACASHDAGSVSADEQGLAQFRIDTALLVSNITRVTIEVADQVQDLESNPATGTFDGSVIVASGPQTFVAHAFSGDVLVGQSQPTTVEVAPAVITSITIRILDLTTPQGAPIFGPILNSLSFPTTNEAETPASFAISVIAPAGDPVTYAWTSSCPDAVFSAPDAATTTWTKPGSGTCTINVSATSNGFTISQSFVIVVFPAGSNRGAAAITGVFVTTPTLQLTLPDLGCSTMSNQLTANASCPSPIASPNVSAYQVVVVDWGRSLPGTIELTDNCGGRFGTTSRAPDSTTGFWLPPAAGGTCILTARAVNGDGLASTTSAGVYARPGTAPTAQPPQFSGFLDFGCSFSTSFTSFCGFVGSGRTVTLFGNTFWSDGHPGTVTVSDNCAAAPVPQVPDTSSVTVSWIFPVSQFGRSCTTTVEATNLEGVTSFASANYTAF
ncbi:MAG TPA: hypothetical protein VHN14_28905 [Kofleriaceae bacterium]|nr:hypothetical protein [Kofleriaceae bacterium]